MLRKLKTSSDTVAVYFCNVCSRKVTFSCDFVEKAYGGEIPQRTLDYLEQGHAQTCLPEEERQLNENAARMRYDLDVFDAERLAREFDDNPRLP